MTGNDVELMLTEQAACDMPPYERLLGDAMRGQNELFARQDVVEAQWRAVGPILGNAAPFYQYQPGTWGPPEAQQLINNDGPWIDPKLIDPNTTDAKPVDARPVDTKTTKSKANPKAQQGS
jgi:glucose-6-phosphate 1-dehydrogenase